MAGMKKCTCGGTVRIESSFYKKKRVHKIICNNCTKRVLYTNNFSKSSVIKSWNEAIEKYWLEKVERLC